MPTTASGIWYPDSADGVDLWNHYQDMAESIEPFIAKPLGRILLTANQSIPNTTHTAVNFTTEVWDTHGFHSNVTNTDRVVPNVAGYYRVSGMAAYSGADIDGERRCYITKNGTRQTPNFRNHAQLVLQDVPFWGSRILSCNGTTDYFGLGAYHSAGAALVVLGSGSDTADTPTTWLEWEYLRPL